MTEKIKENNYPRETNRPDRTAFDRGGRLLTPQKIPEKSSFQKVLDETSQGTDFSTTAPESQKTGTETREAVKGVVSQQERYGKEKEDFKKRSTDREKDRDSTSKSESRDSGTTRVKEADKRVIARSNISERRHHGEGGGQQGGGKGTGQSGKGSNLITATGLKGIRLGPQEIVEGRFALQMQKAAAEATAMAQKAKAPQMIPKALLDQLVQYCRIITKTDGDKEIDMQLHEEIFKGLKLRVASVKGKVEATFITHSEEVRDLFQARKGEIHKDLEEKGIEVKNINVIMV